MPFDFVWVAGQWIRTGAVLLAFFEGALIAFLLPITLLECWGDGPLECLKYYFGWFLQWNKWFFTVVTFFSFAIAVIGLFINLAVMIVGSPFAK